MGKYEDEPSPNPTPLGESASAISLHPQDLAEPIPPLPHQQQQGRYFDDDPTEFQSDDLPPLYSDHDLDAPVLGGTNGRGPIDPLLPANTAGLKVQPFHRDRNTGAEYYVDSRLDNDPEFLASHIDHLAAVPPRPFLHLRGTHSKTIRSEGKTRRRDIVDFDLRLELTHLLYEDIHTRRAWNNLIAASNFAKVRRGTIFATRASGFGGGGAASPSPEDGVTDLAAWTQRYCASRAGLKAFTLERRVVGWDFDMVRDRVERLVRSTNYRGHVKIEFPVNNARVDVYNDCRTNRWRLTKWIEMLFVFTLMFLFSWPWLFFRTARWEVLAAEWNMSTVDQATGRKRYASLSEERFYNIWARPIQKAILERRQGTLDQSDINDLDSPQSQPQTGFAGVVQAGVEAMGVVNRSFGWGADE